MDLNTLIHREAEERLRADSATTLCARIAHLGMADMFRDRIDLRRRTGFAAAGVDAAAPLPRV